MGPVADSPLPSLADVADRPRQSLVARPTHPASAASWTPCGPSSSAHGSPGPAPAVDPLDRRAVAGVPPASRGGAAGDLGAVHPGRAPAAASVVHLPSRDSVRPDGVDSMVLDAGNGEPTRLLVLRFNDTRPRTATSPCRRGSGGCRKGSCRAGRALPIRGAGTSARCPIRGRRGRKAGCPGDFRPVIAAVLDAETRATRALPRHSRCLGRGALGARRRRGSLATTPANALSVGFHHL